MAKLWQRFVGMRFRTKMTVTYLSMALVPFVIFALVSGSVFVAQARSTAVSHTAQITAQVSGSMDAYISSIDKTADFVVRTLLRRDILDKSVKQAEWQSGQVAIRRTLDDIAKSHPEVAGILVAMDDDRYISIGMSRISRDPFARESWYRKAEAEPDRIVLVSNDTGRNIVTREDYSVDNVFSLVKAVRDPATGNIRGVILFDVRHDLIKDSINSVTIGEQGFVFVLDDQDNMVYTQENDVVYRVNPAWFSRENQEPITATIHGSSYQIRCDYSDYTGWKTVGVFPLREVMGGVNSIYYILALCIVVTIGMVAFVSLILARTVTKPISKLQRLMHQAESGDLSVRFHIRYNDEVGQLGHSFNHMLDRVDSLIHRVYQEQQSKRDAELKILQEQIKPHFLYNTLDTITWMARDYGATDIVRLVEALTSMFRIGLSHGKDFILLGEEITHIANYLYIQKIRYKDKLSYHIDLDDSLLPHHVPKLILQPLVENALYHGIKQKRGGGTITITGRVVGEDFQLRVADDGAGMAPERVTHLQGQLDRVLETEQKESFGLFYIQERMLLCYGAGYGLVLDSQLGIGTSVTLTLPLHGREQ